MNQEDIFKLLLIVLLLANREISRTGDRDDESDAAFSYSALNDVLILVMLLNGFSASQVTQADSRTTF